MSKKDKLIKDVKRGRRISPEEADKLLNHIGYTARNQEGSHKVYTNGKRTISIVQSDKELLKPYIKQLQELLREEGY